MTRLADIPVNVVYGCHNAVSDSHIISLCECGIPGRAEILSRPRHAPAWSTRRSPVTRWTLRVRVGDAQPYEVTTHQIVSAKEWQQLVVGATANVLVDPLDSRMVLLLGERSVALGWHSDSGQ
jgi:hypothetical protein